MKIKLLVSAMALVAFATPAAAQDFTGARIEGRIGWDKVKIESSVEDADEDFDGSTSEKNIGYGAEIGYDAQLGTALVVGGYAGIDFTDADFCSEVFGDDLACVETGRNLTLGVRAGAAAGPGLFYVKGGYTNAKLRSSYEDFEDILDDVSDSDTLDGYHLGVGGEIGFGSAGTNMYAKLEYVYTNYNSVDDNFEDIEVESDLKRHQVMVGLGLRF